LASWDGSRQRKTITLLGWQRCAQRSLILKTLSGGPMLPLMRHS
jgi:hypothetical protein